MSDRSAIEWTDATWNPLLGCSKVSEGCRNCYAIRTSYRAAHLPHTAKLYEGLTVKRADGSLNWTGGIRLVPERLAQPLSWKRPRRIFVNSQSDLFHEDVPDEFIDRVFGVMALARQHTFQVLTKRPGRMAEYLSDPIRLQAAALRLSLPTGQRGALTWRWPLPNVWLGTSVEDQAAADTRIPHLLATPAAVRFLSCEPLLGPVTLGQWYAEAGVYLNWLTGEYPDGDRAKKVAPGLDWVISGGESGPKHRPMDLDWARSLRDQCADAGVPFLFKQVGGRTPKAGGHLLDGREHLEFPGAQP